MNADEKVCPRCAETVKAAAKVCRFCGNEFGGTYQPSRAERRQAEVQKFVAEGQSKVTSGQTIGFGCLLILVIAIFGSIMSGGKQSNSDQLRSESGNLVLADNGVATATEPTAPSSDWSVSTEQDEMRGKAVHYAVVSSDNEAYFDFPYNGGSRLTMTVRKHPKYGDDVVFQISKGQFVCGVESCSGTINYGKGPERIGLNEPADYDSETLFAASSQSVIKKLKTADKVIVELPFYQEGNRQFTFKTHGLVWPPKP